MFIKWSNINLCSAKGFFENKEFPTCNLEIACKNNKEDKKLCLSRNNLGKNDYIVPDITSYIIQFFCVTKILSILRFLP